MCGCEYGIVTAVAQHIPTPRYSYKEGFPASKIFKKKKNPTPPMEHAFTHVQATTESSSQYLPFCRRQQVNW